MGAASLNIVIWPNSLLRSNWPQWKSKAQMDTIRLQASWHNAGPPQLQTINFQVTVGVTLAPLSLLSLPRNEMSISEPSWLPGRCHKRVCDPFLPLGPQPRVIYVPLPLSLRCSPPGRELPALFHRNRTLSSLLPLSKGQYLPRSKKKNPQRLRTQPACTRSFHKFGINHLAVHKCPEAPSSINV